MHCAVPEYKEGRLTDIPRQRGILKAEFFKEKYEAGISGGVGGLKLKNTFCGGVWIFSGRKHSLICTM